MGLRELILDKHVTEGSYNTRPNKKNQTIGGLLGSPGPTIKEKGGILSFT